jgi:hypothetical protein
MLEAVGLSDISSLIRIEIETKIDDDGGLVFEFAGWSLLSDGSSHLTLVQDIL